MSAGEHRKLSLRVRAATAGDVGAIIAIVNEAFAVETFIEGTRTDEKRMTEMTTKGEFLVGETESGRIVASVYVELRGERGYFGMLAVGPAWQGKGLGRVMVEAAENYCRVQGCKQMDISVLSLRPELPAFYRKLGYAETGREELHPSVPLKAGFVCHAIIMSNKL